MIQISLFEVIFINFTTLCTFIKNGNTSKLHESSGIEYFQKTFRIQHIANVYYVSPSGIRSLLFLLSNIKIASHNKQ